MSSPARLLPLLLGVLVAGPALAQGRFGVRTAPPSSAPHPVAPPPASGGNAGGGWVPRGPPVVRPVPPPYVYGWGFGYRGWLWDPWWTEPVPVGPPTLVAPYGTYVAPLPPPGTPVDEDGLPPVPERSVRRTIFSITADGQHVESKGSAFGLGLGVEGEHLGVLAQWNGFYLDSLTGPGTDNINLVHLHATYAVLSGPQGRLRLHLGGSGAFAPDLSRIGPSIGVSTALGLIGPLGIEGQVSYTPTPFVEFDAFAGVSVGWDHLALRGGYHWTYLDDRGLVDGVPHTERYQGPWIGIGVAL
ncbi:MAG TPA: hypothetical protein VLT82_13575 [Myxococcaceae bacterium]|nr:hypothetical protein [Myxococcaceae bacterium]